MIIDKGVPNPSLHRIGDKSRFFGDFSGKIMNDTSEMTFREACRVAVPWGLLATGITAITAAVAGAGLVFWVQVDLQPNNGAAWHRTLAAGMLVGLLYGWNWTGLPSFALIAGISGIRHRSWTVVGIVMGIYAAFWIIEVVILAVYLLFFLKLPGP